MKKNKLDLCWRQMLQEIDSSGNAARFHFNSPYFFIYFLFPCFFLQPSFFSPEKNLDAPRKTRPCCPFSLQIFFSPPKLLHSAALFFFSALYSLCSQLLPQTPPKKIFCPKSPLFYLPPAALPPCLPPTSFPIYFFPLFSFMLFQIFFPPKVQLSARPLPHFNLTHSHPLPSKDNIFLGFNFQPNKGVHSIPKASCDKRRRKENWMRAFIFINS